MIEDRKAIKLLVEAGYVSEEAADEALQIAHGFSDGPLTAAPGGRIVGARTIDGVHAVGATSFSGFIGEQLGGDGCGEPARPASKNNANDACPESSLHPDDTAVDAFATAMKEKLAAARAKGRGGWQDKVDCTQQHLSHLLRSHVEKGDPRDVANFCMFLHQRGEGILPVANAVPVSTPEDHVTVHLADAGAADSSGRLHREENR
jgi:hypothetical protein